ncbi:MAG: hypothetical protein OEV30_01900 [Ignavibacteria bacterium]|nr:hypothetical protein [Ignavibacteria bacterium]
MNVSMVYTGCLVRDPTGGLDLGPPNHFVVVSEDMDITITPVSVNP